MRRLVIKIGSNILTSENNGLDLERIASLADDISRVKDAGYEVVIVSSGAVAAGMKKLGLKEKPRDIILKQASAAVGQSSLMWAYEKCFNTHGKKVAQILLTRDDFSDRKRYINSRNTLITLLSYGVIPIINENDTVATDEIRFGDNDHLASLVAGLIDAERFVILSDVEGLFSDDPRKNQEASLIEVVDQITLNWKKRPAAPALQWAAEECFQSSLRQRGLCITGYCKHHQRENKRHNFFIAQRQSSWHRIQAPGDEALFKEGLDRLRVQNQGEHHH